MNDLPINKSLTIQTWGDFLNARARLIHFFHSEGKSDAEIAEAVSADANQIHAIRKATRP